jgi:hypothetical protein
VDEVIPFLCYNKGEEDVWFSGRHEFAKIHHGIYVASSRIWHRHHVKGGGWFRSEGTHLWAVVGACNCGGNWCRILFFLHIMMDGERSGAAFGMTYLKKQKK